MTGMMTPMATQITHDLTFDAPAAEVHAMLLDPAFREQAGPRMKALRTTATVEEVAGGTVVTVDLELSADGLPSFAAKMVGDTIAIHRVETWTSPTGADVEVGIPGKPGEMIGTATLHESGGVTTEHVELEVRVRIPLVGAKIEKLIADMLRKALVAENEAGRDYLSLSR